MSISRNFFGPAREIKSWINQKINSEELWTVKDLCACLNASIPETIDPDYHFSMICCFDGVLLRNSLYVHFEKDDDILAHNAMIYGAKALLTYKQIEDYPCVIVDDVLSSITILAKRMFDRINIPSTVIIGSIGKTTTKNFVDTVYSSKYRTFCNPTNGNTLEYLGFELQRFDKKAEIFVQEVNESDPFNARNCSIALQPNIAIITNIDKSHIGEFGSEELIIEAVKDITTGMGPDDYVLMNCDDKNSISIIPSVVPHVITVGIENSIAECNAVNIEEHPTSIEFDLRYENEVIHIWLPVPGKHNIYNAAMAFIAGRLNDIPTEYIIHSLKKYRQFGYRQHLCQSGQYFVYMDCYNASARSVGNAISVLDSIKCEGKKVAVIGDIAEIEGFEEDTYNEIAKRIDSSSVDVLITYGQDSAMINKKITSRLIQCMHINHRNELNNCLKNLKRQDARVFLFKASRTMALERTIASVFPLVYLKGMMPVGIKYVLWTWRTL